MRSAEAGCSRRKSPSVSLVSSRSSGRNKGVIVFFTSTHTIFSNHRDFGGQLQHQRVDIEANTNVAATLIKTSPRMNFPRVHHHRVTRGKLTAERRLHEAWSAVGQAFLLSPSGYRHGLAVANLGSVIPAAPPKEPPPQTKSTTRLSFDHQSEGRHVKVWISGPELVSI